MEAAAELQSIVKTLSGTRVLEGVSLSLARGRVHALVGPGGSGKTLILKTLCTLLPPDDGKVVLFGEQVNFDDQDGLRHLRSRIGVQ